MLTDLQPSQEIRQAALASFIPFWFKALTLRVEAQELQRDTIVTYERGVRKFIHWLNDQSPSADVIRAWKADLLKANVKPSSINIWLAGVRSFFGWLS